MPPGTQGWQQPPPGTQGWQQQPPQGTQGWPPPGTQGWQQPPPGTQGWQQPTQGGQGWPPPPQVPPGTQGWQQPPQAPQPPQPPPGTQGWPSVPPPPVEPTASNWQAAGSSSWQRDDELPELIPPDERGWDGPVLRRRPPLVAPLVALLGLAIVAGGTVFAAQRFDLLGTAAGPTATAGATTDPNATEEPFGTYDPDRTDDPFATDTPASTDAAGPSGVPTPAATAFSTPPPGEQASIAGTMLYTRDGDIWSVSGTTSTQLLGTGNAYMPVWSPDGKLIYYVQETLQRGKVSPWGSGTSRPPTMTHLATDIMSIRADGSDRKRRFASMRKEGLGSWSTVAIQPDITLDGKTLILVSDLGEVPDFDYRYSGVVLASMSTSGRNLKSLGVDSVTNSYTDALGHNDPDLSPDGKRLAFTYNAKRQGQGQPRIGIVRYPVRKSEPDLSPRGRGYANPSWSPDGRYLAAERVTPDKRDVVILDPDTWEEVARLTKDGKSFAPVWSPNGDQIAYLRVDGLKVDLRVMTLEQGATGPTLALDQAVTVDGTVDPESPPAWFIPEDQRRDLPTSVPGSSEGAATDAPPEETAIP